MGGIFYQTSTWCLVGSPHLLGSRGAPMVTHSGEQMAFPLLFGRIVFEIPVLQGLGFSQESWR